MKRVSTNASNMINPSARVVDGTLVLSLPDAITPIVWRLDLGQTKASALEVRMHDNGNHVLVLRTPKGEIHEIAPYETKAGAVQALMAVSHALESGHGNMRPAGLNTANDAGGGGVAAFRPVRVARGTGRTLLLAIVGVVAIVLVLTAISHLGPRRVDAVDPAQFAADTGVPLPAAPGASTTGSSGSDLATQPVTGVPVSADQFLQQGQLGQAGTPAPQPEPQPGQ